MKQNSKRAANQDPSRQHRERLEQLRRFLHRYGWTLSVTVLALIAVVLLIFVIAGSRPEVKEQNVVEEQTPARYQDGYLCASQALVPYYDRSLNETGTVARGMKITYSTQNPIKKDGKSYYLTYFSTLDYGYVCSDNLTRDEKNIVAERTVYVRTPQNLRLQMDSIELGPLVEQGTSLAVLGYEGIEDGVVDTYRVKYGSETGFIKGMYVTSTYDAATEVFDRFGVYSIHAGRGDVWGGGDAESLDYFPREKASFPDKTMPDPCYGLYLTCDPEVISNIDKYIAFAKTTTINAFVVNIMDGTSVGYPSEVYLEYSPTAYRFANNTIEDYRACVEKLHEAGFYVIGRLTTFNDSFLCGDHPEYAIADLSGKPLYVAGSYWPSAFCRYAWEYKVALAVDAVETMHFDEIQFDYVRFPDGTYNYEKDGTIDYHNEYGETKAQAIQRFLMYATDVLHEYGVYVGADVFGETSGTYVTAYGQYWPAVSNVVDVISGMPYPDHFSQNGTYRPWEHPYETILDWAESAAKRQTETPSPAIARTWIQAYDAIRPPYNTFGPEEVGGEIRALQERGLTGGFMAWNAMCSIPKLESLKPAFDALAVEE